jgi:hypothetical protein
MNNNDCYETTALKLSVNHPIFKEHTSWDYKHTDIKLYSKRNTFLRYSLPTEYFEGEPIHDLMLEFNLTAKVFMMEPRTVYNWHRDAWRNIAFNLLLTDDPNYLTVFAHEHPDSEDLTVSKFMYSPITQVVYEPNTFHLLNSQKPHLAIQYSKVNRYLLTIANYETQPVDSFYGRPADSSSYVNFVNILSERGLIVNASSNPNN